MAQPSTNEFYQEPTKQQRRILILMGHDNRIWEVVGKSYRSIYNDKLKRDQRVPDRLVQEMEQQGRIRRIDNPSAQRLDGWELTGQGREAVTRFKTRKRKGSA